MQTKTLHIAPGFTIPATDYANQANAILGIRKAGKSYTAMKAAEELLENDIPIIAYDPVGIWKNLKIGTGKHKGFPIVVAGGEGADIRLTPANAVDIVRAAMKENVSLVIDLYSPELINKSTWIRIIQETVDLLMYENKSHGLRHIFLEEAAEFIPQKLQQQHYKVYASLERVARMGRNAGLGLTLINQRAEEVNKAILEICELSLLHQQVGKNSLLSVQKWLEVRQLDGVKDIIKSLPTLKRGECWVIGLNDQPKRIHVSAKKTYHPDPNPAAGAEAVQPIARDVSSFVAKMNEQLQNQQNKSLAKSTPKKITPMPETPPSNKAADAMKELLESLRAELQSQREKEKAYLQQLARQSKQMTTFTGFIKRVHLMSSALLGANGEEFKMEENLQIARQTVSKNDTSVPKINIIVPKSRPIVPGKGSSLNKAETLIITFLAQFPERSFSKVQIAVATGYRAGGGSFNNALSRLNVLGFLVRDIKLRVNTDRLGSIIEAVGEITPQAYGYEAFKDNLNKAEREVYSVLMSDPQRQFTKEEIARESESGYQPGGGSFNNAISRLSSLELLIRPSQGFYQLNPELLEI